MTESLDVRLGPHHETAVHWLNMGDDLVDGGAEPAWWWVEHPSSCTQRIEPDIATGEPRVAYDCDVDRYVNEGGWEGLAADTVPPGVPGRYPFVLWTVEHPSTPAGGPEYDQGVEFIDNDPPLTPVECDRLADRLDARTAYLDHSWMGDDQHAIRIIRAWRNLDDDTRAAADLIVDVQQEIATYLRSVEFPSAVVTAERHANGVLIVSTPDDSRATIHPTFDGWTWRRCGTDSVGGGAANLGDAVVAVLAYLGYHHDHVYRHDGNIPALMAWLSDRVEFICTTFVPHTNTVSDPGVGEVRITDSGTGNALAVMRIGDVIDARDGNLKAIAWDRGR